MTFVTFTSEKLATGPLACCYPHLGSVGVIIGQMDDEYNVQFSSDCFDEDGRHEIAEECAVVLSRDEFESADILAAQVLNNYNSSRSVPADSSKKESCSCNCGSNCHNKEKEEVEVPHGLIGFLEIYQMLLPMFKENDLFAEGGEIEGSLDVVRMIALTYKEAYRRGKEGESFFLKKDTQSEWREMKPEDVHNTNLEVKYVKKPCKTEYPEWPQDIGDGYFPVKGTVGKMSHPSWPDESIWVRFEGTTYGNTCYGKLFDCFLVREVDNNG